MVGDGTPPDEYSGKLGWRCADLNCTHLGGCKHKVLWSDSGYTELRGEMVWNDDDQKWDWSVRVDHYGSMAGRASLVEAMATKHIRRMASQVGLAFRGPKVSLYDED